MYALPKGTKDFLPNEKILREQIVSVLKKTFELYCYNPMETPIIERFETLASKYAGGAEILKETFQFQDQGKRDLGLRYDLTVPFARVIASNPKLRMPFKRYQIGKVLRDGPVTTNRYREFTQCDIDVVGSNAIFYDAEMVSIASKAFEELGLEAEIRVNNRKVLNGIMEDAGIEEEKWGDAILSVDKLDKIAWKGVEKELLEKGFSAEQTAKIQELISIKGSNEERIAELEKRISSEQGKKGLEELKEIISFGKRLFFKNVSVNFSLARGLAYYTGSIFEVVLKNSSVKSTVTAGGRYDSMIGQFAGKNEFPAVGISFGLDRIYDALKEKQKTEKKTVTELYIIPLGTFNESLELLEKVRGLGIKADIDAKGKSISKNLDYANKMNIPLIAILGENELKEGKIMVKDMETGKQEKIALNELEKLKELVNSKKADLKK